MSRTGIYGVALVLAALIGASSSSTQAAQILLYAQLDGPSEVPPNASPGNGFASLALDTTSLIMQLEVAFSDLVGLTTAAHIHAPTALPDSGVTGVATQAPSFVGFPLGVSSGVYSQSFDLTAANTYNPAFITNNGGTVDSARAVLISALLSQRAYLNIHTSVFPSGEIRGFFTPVPEPSTLRLAGLTLGLVGALCWRSRKA